MHHEIMSHPSIMYHSAGIDPGYSGCSAPCRPLPHNGGQVSVSRSVPHWRPAIEYIGQIAAYYYLTDYVALSRPFDPVFR